MENENKIEMPTSETKSACLPSYKVLARREIKFRAWNREKLSWIYLPETGDIELKQDDMIEFDYDDDTIELMQHTGYKDKNDKGIYEGDILRYYPCEEEPIFFHGLAFVDNTRVGGQLEIIQCDNLGGRMVLDSSSFWNDDREIIGNIYENPELVPKSV